jgi:hypothetical protein
MKSNWKVMIALAVLVGAVLWGFNSLRGYSYSGTDLNIAVGSGPITVINPSEAAVSVSLVSTSPGTITVASRTEGVAGRSATQGSGRNTGQLYEFELPPGESTFTVTRGANVNLVAMTDTGLQITVQPLDGSGSQTTLLVSVIAILASLFYLSRLNGHRWISAARRQKAVDQAAAQATERENFKRIYGRVGSNKS